MVATNLKAETMSLMDKRSCVEAEMNAIIERLCQPGGAGLSGNLVDSEGKKMGKNMHFAFIKGFPRSDIDIPVVRAERHRLAELRRDHKEITEKIDENIQVLHSARLAPRSSSLGESGKDEGLNNQNSSIFNAIGSSSSHNLLSSSAAMDMDVIVSVPFAMVDEIADGSPAADDGLQLGDQIVRFGNVEAGDNLHQRLASESRTNEGHAIPVVVLRQGAVINLTVTPRTWQGMGLLGCHFRIL